MPLNKTPINIPFQSGLDLKTDPLQVPVGKFEVLNNSVFDSIGRLTKRNGFGYLASNPTNTPKSLTTFKNTLLAYGSDNSLESYNSQTQNWISQGFIQPVSLSTTSLIRNNLNQFQVDAVVSGNLACVVYTETSDFINYDFKYAICDATTGLAVVAPTVIPLCTGYPPRVYLLGNYFLILFYRASGILWYFAVNKTTFATTTNQFIANIASTTNIAYDAVTNGGYLYCVYTDYNGYVKALSMSDHLVINSPVVIDNSLASNPNTTSVCVDTTQTPNVLWAVYAGASYSKYFYTNISGTTIYSGTYGSAGLSTATVNIATTAQNNTCTVFSEYTGGTIGNTVDVTNITTGGSLTVTNTIHNMGLSSRAFIFNNTPCVWFAYSSQYQSSYFLVNSSANVLARVAYQNGAGYSNSGLVNITQSENAFFFPYLYKDLILAANGAIAGSTYSQLGINLVSFSLSTRPQSVETISNLLLTGGFLWSYDGVNLVENNFFLWPEATRSGATTNTHGSVEICNLTAGSTTITSSYITGSTDIMNGMGVSGIGIPDGSYVTEISLSTGTVKISNPAQLTGSETITFQAGIKNTGAQDITLQYVFTYEWTDSQGNVFRSAPSIPFSVIIPSGTTNGQANVISVPTLPLSYKNAPQVKIVGYRWSTNQQVFYQFTSVQQPPLNTTLSSAININDPYSDSSILGNPILYTTGGTLPNDAPAPINAMTLFDDRVWLINAEDPNSLWFSKQIIEATALEFSGYLTYYVSPTANGQGRSGPMTSLAVIDDKLIIFSKNCIRYINGTGPDNTGSNNQYSQPYLITSPVGCANQASIAVIPRGIMFQSDHGFWILGHDLSVEYIGLDVEAYNSYQCLSATTIPGTTQVRFAMSNGTILIFDYLVGQWGTFSGVAPISSILYNSLQTLLDASGNAYQETPGTYLDGANPVLMNFTTSWIQLAGLQGFQRAYFFYLLGQYISPHQLTLSVAYDYNSTPAQTSQISPINYGSSNNVEQWKVFLKNQKCQSFQVSLQESYDASFGVAPGAGFTLSGLNLVVGLKKGYRPIASKTSIGGGTA